MTAHTDAALSDDELRETLDMIGTVLASVSDRVDAQTGVLDRVNKTATEARQAAFAARSQTDPQKYGELVGETIDGRINDNLVRMARMITELRHATNAASEALQKAEEDKFALFRGRVASITGQARSTLTRENGQPTDSNLAQPSSVILLRARTPICASVF